MEILYILYTIARDFYTFFSFIKKDSSWLGFMFYLQKKYKIVEKSLAFWFFFCNIQTVT